MKQHLLVLIILAGIFSASCVSQKKYTELDNRNKQCQSELGDAQQRNLDLASENTEQSSRLQRMGKEVDKLKRDTLTMGISLRDALADKKHIEKAYTDLSESTEKLKRGNRDEVQTLLSELQLAQERLMRKQDSLQVMERELAAKQRNLVELQNILARKDSAVNALKNKVTQALLGFQGKGLSIEIKNGKVYVSLEESLLFQSGSWTVNSRGETAIKDLARVLESNADINVLIEGHTDNVPYKGAGQVRDNWDLSVMRATAIVKIITTSSRVSPARLTAAGRSEFIPVVSNGTSDGRAKNRRTEIILTPKLDELFKILEAN
ncbi:MAG: OmpA family protein [Bacteroidales bacterium]|nr:OmpA family protein [Bacteroidales bacterium]